jgi:hypothetical protein
MLKPYLGTSCNNNAELQEFFASQTVSEQKSADHQGSSG